MSSTSEREPAQVAQVSLSLAKTDAKQLVGSRLGGLRSSSGLVTLRAILHDALPEKKPRRKKSEEPGAKHSAALVAALVVYSGVAWL